MAKPDTSPLTAAQREIMEIVWARGEVTVAGVREALSAKRDVARNTVQTMMVRLEDRGWLTHREAGTVVCVFGQETGGTCRSARESLRWSIDCSRVRPRKWSRRSSSTEGLRQAKRNGFAE